MVLKDILPWSGPAPFGCCSFNYRIRLLLHIEYYMFSLGFHIIFVCKIDICHNIVIYSTSFSSFDLIDMPFGPTILISESTYKQWIQRL